MVEDKGCFFTITAVNMFHGIKPFKIGSIVKLVKEPQNDYDAEAIRVELRHAGPSGYVANSTRTVAKGTYSGGRMYDKILDVDYGVVKFILNDYVIAKSFGKDELEKERSNEDSDVHFI